MFNYIFRPERYKKLRNYAVTFRCFAVNSLRFRFEIYFGL